MWLRRHQDADARRKMRKEFQGATVQGAIEATDAGLGDFYSELYERAIDFGGHPNAKGVTASMRLEDDSYFGIYLHGDDLVLHHCLDSTARTGLCSLCLFSHMLPERFTTLGIAERFYELYYRKHV